MMLSCAFLQECKKHNFLNMKKLFSWGDALHPFLQNKISA